MVLELPTIMEMGSSYLPSTSRSSAVIYHKGRISAPSQTSSIVSLVVPQGLVARPRWPPLSGLATLVAFQSRAVK